MSYLSNQYKTFLEGFRLDEWLNVSQAYESGLITGVAVTLVVILLILLVRRILSKSDKNKGVRVAGEKGEMFITLNAFREFVKRTLKEVSDVKLEHVKLRQYRNSLALKIYISATPEAQLVQLRDDIQERMITKAESHLGLPMALKVNIAVKSLEASQRKQGKKQEAVEPKPESTTTSDFDSGTTAEENAADSTRNY